MKSSIGVFLFSLVLAVNATPPMPPIIVRISAIPQATPISTNTANLSWAYPMPNPTVGFRVYSGSTSQVYSTTIDVGTNLSARVIAPSLTNYYAVKAYSTNGTESHFSPEVMFVPSIQNAVVYLYVQTNSSPNGKNWGLLTASPVYEITNPPATIFYRLLIKTNP